MSDKALIKKRRYFVVFDRKAIGPFCDRANADEAVSELKGWFSKCLIDSDNGSYFADCKVATVRDQMKIICEKTPICIDCIKINDKNLRTYAQHLTIY